MPGIFNIKAVSIQTQTGTWLFSGIGTVYTLLQTLNNTNPVVLNKTQQSQDIGAKVLVALPNSSGIYLDSAIVPTSQNSLPVGFHVPFAQLQVNSLATDGDHSASFRLRVGAALAAPGALNLAYPISSLNTLLATTFGLDYTGTATSLVVLDGLYILGTYTQISTSWVITNVTHPGQNFQVGDTVKISDPSLIFDFSTITSVAVGPSITVTAPFPVQSTTEIEFVIPAMSSGTYSVEIHDNGTQFTGWAVVGTLTVFVINTSGLYKIVSGKTHDTLYLDSSTDNTTENVKIPNPFFKTGYIGQ